MIKTKLSAFKAREYYEDGLEADDFLSMQRNVRHPIFSFSRVGRTVTQLCDGSCIYIGGEHEDCYDPDWCIYNDVVQVRALV